MAWTRSALRKARDERDDVTETLLETYLMAADDADEVEVDVLELVVDVEVVLTDEVVGMDEVVEVVFEVVDDDLELVVDDLSVEVDTEVDDFKADVREKSGERE